MLVSSSSASNTQFLIVTEYPAWSCASSLAEYLSTRAVQLRVGGSQVDFVRSAPLLRTYAPCGLVQGLGTRVEASKRGRGGLARRLVLTALVATHLPGWETVREISPVCATKNLPASTSRGASALVFDALVFDAPSAAAALALDTVKMYRTESGLLPAA